MKKSTQPDIAGRRGFLKGVAVAGGIGALSAVSANTLTTGVEQSSEPDNPEPQRSRGYHETEHIKAYYRALRS